MGCYNVICNFLKTPIREDDECYMVFFKNPLNKAYKEVYINGSDTFYEMVKSMYVGYLHGTYNDYGWLNEHRDKRDDILSNNVLSYFISKEAIDFINSYKGTYDEQYPQFSVDSCANNIYTRALEENSRWAKIGFHTPKDDYVKLLQKDKDILITISKLYVFNEENGIQMFQLGFYERYYRQLESYETFKAFNELRTKIILKNEKKWTDQCDGF